MSGVLERTLNIIELLAHHAKGLSLGVISNQLTLPRSATHRLLTELVEVGYLRQKGDLGDYQLTSKLMSLGLKFLSNTGIIELTKPSLDKLAGFSGELVRLAGIDNNQLIWIAKAQGAKTGLRYDPDMGMEARLSCTSSGMAWLMTMKNEDAIALVKSQGIGSREEYAINAPETIEEVMNLVSQSRARGFSFTIETHTPGITTIAAPVIAENGKAIGVVSISGPHFRLNEATMMGFGEALLQTAKEIAMSQHAFPLYVGNAA